MSTFDLSVRFFLQLPVVLLACRAVSKAAGWIGQPPVVGEMIAGVLRELAFHLFTVGSVFMAMPTTLMATPMFNWIFGAKTILPTLRSIA